MNFSYAFGIAALMTLAALPAAAQSPSTDTPALRGTPSAAGGACCATLGEVRQNIDRIDAQLLKLMAERGTYVVEAGRFKADVASVHDGARVERIIARIRGLAEAEKLSPDVAEATWRAMIAAFTEYEQKTLQGK